MNRRGFFKSILGGLACLLPLKEVEATDKSWDLLIKNRKPLNSLRELHISPEALADIKAWDINDKIFGVEFKGSI